MLNLIKFTIIFLFKRNYKKYLLSPTLSSSRRRWRRGGEQLIRFSIIFFSITCYAQNTAHRYQSDDAVPHYKVIVIGAGMAGLAAANFLQKNHIPVAVLEARNRIGGRIHTAHPWGFALDLGAGWIHGVKNNPVAVMVKQLHITTLPTLYNDGDNTEKFKSFDLYISKDKKLSAIEINQWVKLINQFNDEVEKSANHLSIEDVFRNFIQQKNMSENDARILHYLLFNIYTYEFAVDMDVLSSHAEQVYKHSRVSGRNELFPYGYSQILPALAKNIPIMLNQPVKKIQYDKNGVDIFTDKQHYHADYVIITVPLGVLKSGAIEFVPQLPQEKQNAIQQLGMAIYNKIYLFFDFPFWNTKIEWINYIPARDDQAKKPDIMNYYKFTKLPILLMFTGGSLAKEVEEWSDTKTIDFAMSELKKIYGDHIPNPSAYIITRWLKDTYSRGSYSFLPKSVEIKNYKILSQPVMDRLFFAGEATSLSDPATVHGAFMTGIRAGKEVFLSINGNRSNPSLLSLNKP